MRQDVLSQTAGRLGHGDLLSECGRVFRRNQELLQAFGPQPPLQDAGLDGVELLDNGTILFSITTNVFSETLGIMLTSGDLLSDQGAIVHTSQQLLASFLSNPQDGAYGLAAFHRWVHNGVLRMFEGFGWPSLESLPTVLAIAGAAAGPLVKLEVSGLAAPVAPLSHTAIWHPGQGDCTAIQALIQWLQRASQPAARVLNRKEIERRILAIKAERDDFFAFEAVPDPLVEAEFEAQIRDLEVEPQTLLVLDSPKGSQVEAFMPKAPSSALVFYSALGFERL